MRRVTGQSLHPSFRLRAVFGPPHQRRTPLHFLGKSERGLVQTPNCLSCCTSRNTPLAACQGLSILDCAVRKRAGGQGGVDEGRGVVMVRLGYMCVVSLLSRGLPVPQAETAL
jgi:hypothetical protein